MVSAKWRRPQLEPQPRPLRVTGAALVALGGALFFWFRALSSASLGDISSVGLVSALPADFFIAVGVLTTGFCVLLHQRAPALVLGLFAAALIFVLHGTPALLYDAPRYAWSYKHIGVTSFVQNFGAVNPNLDAYHNWPGFFALGALLLDTAGLQSAFAVAPWAQVCFNVLYGGAALLIFRAVTQDRRLVWLGLWFFLAGNWVGQDYYAPQALGYFFFLMIVGITLSYFSRPTEEMPAFLERFSFLRRPARRRNIVQLRAPAEPRPRRTAGLVLVLALLLFAVVASHQLTQVIAALGLGALAVFGASRLKALPLVAGVMIAAWALTVAAPFVTGHSDWIFGSLGNLRGNYESSVSDRFQGSSGRFLVLAVQMGVTLLLWTLAFVGGVRRLRRGFWDLPLVLLAVVPFGVLILQSYGGEMLIRIHLFTLPFMSFFAAAALYPHISSRVSWRTSASSTVLSAALLGGFLFAYYGNEAMNHFSAGEVAAANFIYEVAPTGSLVLTGTFSAPSNFDRYGQVTYRALNEMPEFAGQTLGAAEVDEVAALMSGSQYTNSYLLINQAQLEHDRSRYALGNSLATFETFLAASGRFSLVFENGSSRVYTLSGTPSTAELLPLPFIQPLEVASW